MPTKRGCATSRPVPLHPAFRPVLIIPLHHHRKMATVVLRAFQLRITFNSDESKVRSIKYVPWKNHSVHLGLTLLMLLEMMLAKICIHHQRLHSCKHWPFFLPGFQHSLDSGKRHSIGSCISCIHSYFLLATICVPLSYRKANAIIHKRIVPVAEYYCHLHVCVLF